MNQLEIRERKIKMAYNALGQFFVHVYCADGSFCHYGPFSTGMEAAQCIHDIENPTFFYDEFDN